MNTKTESEPPSLVAVYRESWLTNGMLLPSLIMVLLILSLCWRNVVQVFTFR